MLLLHGDMDQIERNKVITAFKKQTVSILVATDVAGTTKHRYVCTLALGQYGNHEIKFLSQLEVWIYHTLELSLITMSLVISIPTRIELVELVELEKKVRLIRWSRRETKNLLDIWSEISKERIRKYPKV